MRSEGIQIGRIYGIPIFLHPSWFFIFGLIALSSFPNTKRSTSVFLNRGCWGLGLVTSVLFFGSLVFHEMAHSVIAKHYKIPVVSITLFIFGGVARIGRDPSRAIEEFNIAGGRPDFEFPARWGFGIVYLQLERMGYSRLLPDRLQGSMPVSRCSICCQVFRWMEGAFLGPSSGVSRRTIHARRASPRAVARLSRTG